MSKTTATTIDISNPDVSDEALVTRKECAEFLRTTVVNWDRLVSQGKAPARVTPDGVRPLWRTGDIRQFVGWKSSQVTAE